MDLQKIMTCSRGRQLHEVQADRAAPARGNRQRVEQASRAAVFGFDSLACRARPDEEVKVGGEGWPPDQASRQRQGFVASEVAAQGSGVKLVEDQPAQLRVRRDAEPVAARRAAVEEACLPHETAARRPVTSRDGLPCKVDRLAGKGRCTLSDRREQGILGQGSRQAC